MLYRKKSVVYANLKHQGERRYYELDIPTVSKLTITVLECGGNVRV